MPALAIAILLVAIGFTEFCRWCAASEATDDPDGM
jgi:nitrogen fixation-related uncharacterized protein